jgi:neutral ceramidase
MRRIGLLAVLVLNALLSGAGAAQPPVTWQAGAASVDITPDANLWMAGFGSRNRPSEGVQLKLHAKALALADAEGGRFVFVTFDFIGVPRALRKSLETRFAATYHLQPEQFVLTASHTHSGPEIREYKLPAGADHSPEAALIPGYRAVLEEKIFALVGEALQKLAPARVSYTRARAGFAMNRRRPQPKGNYTDASYPDGPVDHDVPVLRVDGPDGKLRAVLFGYACHNTTLSFYKISGDYAGYAQEYLQTDHPGTVALFMTGCAGDQNPYPRNTVALAQVHGRTLATAVDAALGAVPIPLTGALRSAYREIALRYAPPPAAAEFEARLASKDRIESNHARRMLDYIAKDGAIPATYPYPVQVVQLGSELKLVALGGEAVVDYSLRLKQQFGGPHSVWIAAYSNDVMAYIPSERVLREGGYEAVTSMRNSIHPGPWAPGLEDQIVAAVTELDRGTAGAK